MAAELIPTTTEELNYSPGHVYGPAPSSIPRNYREAITSKEARFWKLAMRDEIHSLTEENKSCELVELPPGKKALKSIWVFKEKPNANGTESRYKARLCAQGCRQIPGIDFNETWAGVARHPSIRILCSIAARRGLKLMQLDIKTAFLQGDLDEEIYLEQPEGFDTKDDLKKLVWWLRKSIYGLRQANRNFLKLLNRLLIKYGLQPCPVDPCIYYRCNGDEILILAIWVDDIIFGSTSDSTNKSFIEYLSQHFSVTAGPVKTFLGLEFHHDESQKKLFVTQTRYIEQVLKRYNMEECNPVDVPADPHTRLTKEMSPQSDEVRQQMKKFPFKEAIGSLLYAATLTRLDTAFAVGCVARHSEDPGPAHLKALKKILAYLKATKHFGLCFDGNCPEGLKAFSDADFASDIDTRRSTTGYVCMFGGTPVSYCSRRQQLVTTSTTEAEYVAECECVKEVVWLRNVLSHLGEEQTGPTTLYCDNQSAIRLVKNPEFHHRTKHIDVKFHFVREKQEEKVIDAVYVHTDSQLADIFTKPMEKSRFVRLRQALGVIDTREKS